MLSSVVRRSFVRSSTDVALLNFDVVAQGWAGFWIPGRTWLDLNLDLDLDLDTAAWERIFVILE